LLAAIFFTWSLLLCFLSRALWSVERNGLRLGSLFGLILVLGLSDFGSESGRILVSSGTLHLLDGLLLNSFNFFEQKTHFVLFSKREFGRV